MPELLEHSPRPTQPTTSSRRHLLIVFVYATQVCWETQPRSLWKILIHIKVSVEWHLTSFVISSYQRRYICCTSLLLSNKKSCLIFIEGLTDHQCMLLHFAIYFYLFIYLFICLFVYFSEEELDDEEVYKMASIMSSSGGLEAMLSR